MKGKYMIAFVNNIPNYPLNKYVVARYEGGKLWFWGSYETKDRAEEVADEVIDGLVLVTKTAGKEGMNEGRRNNKQSISKGVINETL